MKKYIIIIIICLCIITILTINENCTQQYHNIKSDFNSKLLQLTGNDYYVHNKFINNEIYAKYIINSNTPICIIIFIPDNKHMSNYFEIIKLMYNYGSILIYNPKKYYKFFFNNINQKKINDANLVWYHCISNLLIESQKIILYGIEDGCFTALNLAASLSKNMDNNYPKSIILHNPHYSNYKNNIFDKEILCNLYSENYIIPLLNPYINIVMFNTNTNDYIIELLKKNIINFKYINTNNNENYYDEIIYSIAELEKN